MQTLPPTAAGPDLRGLPLPALAAALDALGVGATHAGRVFGALHRHGKSLDQLDFLGWRRLAAVQAAHLAPARVVGRHASPDGSEKLVYALADGKRVEGVLIPTRADRVTLCVSTQAGCAMGCTFCATATLGLERHLSAGEIIAQITEARALVAADGRRLTHLVFMGMGEPLHRYEATRDALRILLDPHGASFRARHITVSTVGLVPRIAELAEDFGGRVQLALSLHAGTDATRQRIIPTARRYDLATLRAALDAWPLPGTRALMLEYVVLPGVNDGPEEVAGLAAFTRGLRALVNLIPFNPFPEAGFRAPTVAEVEALGAALKAQGVAHSIRWPRGREAAGACGQLARTTPA